LRKKEISKVGLGMLKIIWSLKYYLVYSSFVTLFAVSSINNHNTSFAKSSEVIKMKDNMSVKSIRQNPGSFRTYFVPFIRYTGGK